MRGIGIIIAIILQAEAALGQSTYSDPRQTIVDDFVAQRARNSGLYQSPPIIHIVPELNTITYAGQFEELNLKLMNEPIGQADVNPNNAIKISGYRIEPHLALSLKNIAIGFSIERSKILEEWAETESYSNYEGRQKSTLESSGLGLNLSFVPFPKMHKKLRLALIVGGKSLNIKHGLSYPKAMNGPTVIEDSEMQNFRYTVNQYEAGLNLSWFAMKQFSIIPWVDYSMYDLSAAKALFAHDSDSGGGLKTVMENDLSLFFLSYPKFRYGLDFSIHIIGLDIRIGGLLGTMANLNKSVDYIEDKSISISVSLDQKGN